MDELFNFSLPDFGGTDSSFGFDNLFNSEGNDFSSIAEQLTKFAFTQATGNGSSGIAPRQIANLFARQLFATRNAPESAGGYFGLSSGQSMARLASMIFRAQRRFR